MVKIKFDFWHHIMRLNYINWAENFLTDAR